VSRFALPDDQWATLCAPKKVPERKRRRYERCFFEINEATTSLPRMAGKDEPDPKFFTGMHHDLIAHAEDMLILCFVREWSYGEVTEDVLEDLPTEDYRALKAECERLKDEMMPDYSADIDPKAPTSGSMPQHHGSQTEGPTFATLSSDGIS
jgi:hypothetical protein